MGWPAHQQRRVGWRYAGHMGHLVLVVDCSSFAYQLPNLLQVSACRRQQQQFLTRQLIQCGLHAPQCDKISPLFGSHMSHMPEVAHRSRRFELQSHL